MAYNINIVSVRRCVKMEISNTEINSKNEIKMAVNKLEEAFRTYKISEIYANDVYDDYGKKKIASLRLEFAKHELAQAWDEVARLGVNFENSEVIKQTFMKR